MAAANLASCAHRAEARAHLEPLTIEANGKPVRFQVEIADTDAERSRGLMFRTSLAPDRGMLFLFPGEDYLSFWMKNTYIPLDIIYISGSGRVVSIARRTKPFSTATIPSGAPAQYVLEIAGGRSDEIGLRIGAKVTHRAIR
ncbi:MAG: DUF192 domain-containing protein [Caulobacteraceae bacterium]